MWHSGRQYEEEDGGVWHSVSNARVSVAQFGRNAELSRCGSYSWIVSFLPVQVCSHSSAVQSLALQQDSTSLVGQQDAAYDTLPVLMNSSVCLTA